jgi:hypothetical protein
MTQKIIVNKHEIAKRINNSFNLGNSLRFSLKTNIDFNRIIKQNSIIDLSKIANEDLKTIIAELILRQILPSLKTI